MIKLRLKTNSPVFELHKRNLETSSVLQTCFVIVFSVELPDHGKVIVPISVELQHDCRVGVHCQSIFHLHRPDIAQPILVSPFSSHLPDHIRRHLEEMRFLSERIDQSILCQFDLLLVKPNIMLRLVNIVSFKFKWKVELVVTCELTLEFISLSLHRVELCL